MNLSANPRKMVTSPKPTTEASSPEASRKNPGAAGFVAAAEDAAPVIPPPLTTTNAQLCE